MLRFNLKEIMKTKSITLKELSERTGLSINTLSLLSTGKSKGIQFDTLEKIISALNVPVEELVIFTESYQTLEILEVDDTDEFIRWFEIYREKGEITQNQNYISCKYKLKDNIERNVLLTVSIFKNIRIVSISGDFPTDILTSGQVVSPDEEDPHRTIDIFDVFVGLICKKLISQNKYNLFYDDSEKIPLIINYFPYKNVSVSSSMFYSLGEVPFEEIDDEIYRMNMRSDYYKIDGYKLSISYDFYKED